MSLDIVARRLLGERYGSLDAIRQERHTIALDGTGGPDTPGAQKRRRDVLNAAMTRRRTDRADDDGGVVA